jgi:hypothetical protein
VASVVAIAPAAAKQARIFDGIVSPGKDAVLSKHPAG